MEETISVSIRAEAAATREERTTKKPEESAIEDRLLEDRAIEDRLDEDSAEDKAIEESAIEDRVIDDRAIEDRAIEERLAEDKTIEDRAMPYEYTPMRARQRRQQCIIFPSVVDGDASGLVMYVRMLV